MAIQSHLPVTKSSCQTRFVTCNVKRVLFPPQVVQESFGSSRCRVYTTTLWMWSCRFGWQLGALSLFSIVWFWVNTISHLFSPVLSTHLKNHAHTHFVMQKTMKQLMVRIQLLASMHSALIHEVSKSISLTNPFIHEFDPTSKRSMIVIVICWTNSPLLPSL